MYRFGTRCTKHHQLLYSSLDTRSNRPRFEESRRHLGVESQRQWNDLAIARTTLLLMGLFSIVTLWADKLRQQQGIEAQRSA